MINLKMILICTWVNFRKWSVNPRIYTLGAIIIAFLIYHLSGLSNFASAKEVAVTPWVFPHLFTQPVMQVFACFTLLLFSDAPFVDRHMPFLVIRSGRRNWVIGQLIYIVLASFVYTAFIFLVSVLALIPNLELSTDWGTVIKTLALSSETIPEDITVTVFMDERMITMFSAIEATLIGFGLFWLVSIFIGVLIFCFNIVIGKMSGLVATGVFIFISYFVVYLGSLSYGTGIYYLSPLSWMTISTLDWNGTINVPSPTYALVFLLVASIFMSIISAKIFTKKDMNIQDWGY